MFSLILEVCFTCSSTVFSQMRISVLVAFASGSVGGVNAGSIRVSTDNLASPP